MRLLILTTTFALAVATCPLASHISLATAAANQTAGQPFLINYRLHNPTSEPHTIVTYNTPLESSVRSRLFTIEGVDAEYTGIIVERTNEFDDVSAFLTLQPGQEITTTIDLNEHYAFYTNGKAMVRANFAIREVEQATAGLKSQKGFRDMETEIAVSNELSFEIEGTSPRRFFVSLKQKAVSYVSCSSSQQSTTNTAISNAKTMLSNSNSVLNGGSTTSFTEWFENTGSVTSSRYSTVKTGHSKISSGFSGSYKVDCSCTDSGTYAYVYPSDRTHTIYVCGAYWNAPTGSYSFDSKPGTLIHEMSHFNDIMGTNDWVYGTSGARSLAKTNPSRAIDNADNVEFYNEGRAQ